MTTNLHTESKVPYTLQYIKENPHRLTYKFAWKGYSVILRPLETTDANKLEVFLNNLSPKTRANYVLEEYGYKTAKEFCVAIGLYDKLRFVLVHNSSIVGLFEYSMDIPETDMVRFQKYGWEIDEKQTCRFGPCLADTFQGKGLASAVFPYLTEIAVKTGNAKMCLWGGVFSDNESAIKHYLKMGFIALGDFINKEGRLCKDMLLDLPKNTSGKHQSNIDKNPH
jgi:diamine N-acetyltransferase